MDYRELVKNAIEYIIDNYANSVDESAQDTANDMAFNRKDEIINIYEDMILKRIEDELEFAFGEYTEDIICELLDEEL